MRAPARPDGSMPGFLMKLIRRLGVAGIGIFLVAACTSRSTPPEKVGSATGLTPTQMGVSSSPSPTPFYVPWLALTPTNITPQPAQPSTAPLPIPSGTAACTSAQLDAVAQASVVDAHMTNTPIVFRNRSGSKCFLAGSPDVTMVDSSGRLVAQAAGPDASVEFQSFPRVPILLPTGTPAIGGSELTAAQSVVGRAVFYLLWYDCSHVSARLAIDLPDAGGRLTIDYAVNPYSPQCGIPSGVTSGVTRSPFVPTGVQWPPAPQYIGVDVQLRVPRVASRGTTLVYYVTIRNTSSLEYLLEPCPDYYASLVGTSKSDQFQLNCAPVGHISPDNAVTFEMRMAVSTTVPVGPNTLTWYLSDARLTGQSAQARVDMRT